LTVSRLDAVMVHMARKSTAQQSPARRTSRKRVRRAARNANGAKLDAKTLRTARELLRNVKKYTPIIQKKLRAAGVKADSASLYSVAMYYPALDRLAKE
jgi:hypothetical protein